MTIAALAEQLSKLDATLRAIEHDVVPRLRHMQAELQERMSAPDV